MIARVDQVQGPLCLTLKKSPEITFPTGHINIKNVLPLELSRHEEPHQVCAPHPDQNPDCSWGCEKCGLVNEFIYQVKNA